MSTQQHPAAWAVFADNGNVRLWSTDHAEVRAFAERIGQPLIALNPGPPAQPAPHDDPIGNACRLLRDAAQEYAEGVSVNGVPDWKNEPDTHSAYIEHITAAHRLEQWAASIGAGGVEPLRRRECLHQIAEPAGERTAKDSAIEHAEYMAQDAERLLSAINTLNAQRDEDGTAFDEAELAQAEEAVSEAFRAMRRGIHEFRKRRDRALRAQAAPAAVAGPSLYQVMAVAKAIHATTPDADDWDSLRQWEVDALRRRAEKVLAALAAPATQPAPVAQGDAEDAARYRWLRQIRLRVGHGDIVVWMDDRNAGKGFQHHKDLWGEALDAAIDDARSQGKVGGEA